MRQKTVHSVARCLISLLIASLVVPALSGGHSRILVADQKAPCGEVSNKSEPVGASSVGIRTSAVRELTYTYEYQPGSTDWVTDSVALYDGSVYITGYTSSFNLPVVGDEYSTSQSGDYDAFIMHLSASEGVISCTYFGGQQNDFGTTIDYLNETGTVYIAGYTESDNETDGFPTTEGAWQESITTSNFEGFIATFTANLSTLLYCSYFGKHYNERIFDMEVAESGLAVCVGDSASSNLDMEGTPENSTHGGAQDGFVMIHNCTPGAGDVPYSSFIGCDGTDIASSVVILEQDSDEIIRLAVAGLTNAENFNYKFGTGAYSNSFSEGGFTYWLLYQNFTGFSAENDYGTFLGEGGLSNISYDYPEIAFDSYREAVVVAGSVTEDWPTAGGAPQVIYGGGTRDAWVGWVDSYGGNGADDLITATFYGGDGTEHGMDVAVSPNQGNVLVVGSSASEDAPTAGLRSTEQEDDRDAWIARYPRPATGRRTTSLNYSTLIDFGGVSEFWTVSADPRSDYPLCSGVETESGSSTGQDIIHSEVVLPTEPVLTVLDAPDEDEIDDVGDRIRISATVEPGTNLTGAEIDSVSLVLVFDNGTSRWIDAEDKSGALYETDTELNATEGNLEAWYFMAISKDNGQSWDWANGTADLPSANRTRPFAPEVPPLSDIWQSVSMYLVLVATAVVALLLSVVGGTSGIGGIAGAVVAVSVGVALVWLNALNVPGIWEPVRIILCYSYVALWANFNVLIPILFKRSLGMRKSIFLGFGLAWALLVVATVPQLNIFPLEGLSLLEYGVLYAGLIALSVAGFAGAFDNVYAALAALAGLIWGGLSVIVPSVIEGLFSLLGGAFGG